MLRRDQNTNEHRTPEEALASIFDSGLGRLPKIAKACYGQMTLSVVNAAPEGMHGLVGVGPGGIYWVIPELNQAIAFVKWENVRTFTDRHGELTCDYRQSVYETDDENDFGEVSFLVRMEHPDDARKLVFLAAQFQAESLTDT
jgi:hypothetical protein